MRRGYYIIRITPTPDGKPHCYMQAIVGPIATQLEAHRCIVGMLERAGDAVEPRVCYYSVLSARPDSDGFLEDLWDAEMHGVERHHWEWL